MLIQTIKEISKNYESIIDVNKARCEKIKENINDLDNVDRLFEKLETTIKSKDNANFVFIARNELFFEEIVEGLDDLMINTYHKHQNKEAFMLQLKKSYVLRGVKGMQFAWMPIIIKRG